MKQTHKLTCISCPTSCNLIVIEEDGRIISVKGNECKKGIEYAKSEVLNPERILTTTVKVSDGRLPMLPVRSSKPLPKSKIRNYVKLISKIKVGAPIEMGDVIIRNINNTDVDIVASRKIEGRQAIED